MKPWVTLAQATAPDGEALELRCRGHEFLILAGGYDLMSSDDDASSRALAELGCAPIANRATATVLVGGLGMGFTAGAALAALGKDATVEVAELVDAVAEWNRGPLADLAGRPLDDPRCKVLITDVREAIAAKRSAYDAILLDVDNGPDALAHPSNGRLYDGRGVAAAHAALRPGGVLGVWSYSDDTGFTKRLRRGGFDTRVERVTASRKGRGRYHYIWVAVRR